MPFAISFIGPHNAGKTTLLQALTKELKARGLRIGFLKSSKEEEAERERPGADTLLLKEAGALPSVFWGAKELALSFNAPPKNDFTFWSVVGRYFGDCDCVLCEGFKGLKSLPKIEIVPQGQKEGFWTQVPGVVALVSERVFPDFPCFHPESIKALADFILAIKPLRKEKVTLLVDGQVVGLTQFVSQALAGVVKGFVQNLRGIGPLHSVELQIKFFEDDF